MADPLRRFAVLGDIHAEHVRLEAALATLDRLGVDAVLSVGDIVDGHGDVERTVSLLRARGVIAVRGNHDRWLLEGTFISDAQRALTPGWTLRDELSDASLGWLAALPATRTLACARGALLLCHGVGDNDMARFREHTAVEECDDMETLVAEDLYSVAIAGHSHERMARRLGGLWWLNAGTLSRRDEPGFATVDLERAAMCLYDVDEAGAVTAAETFRL